MQKVRGKSERVCLQTREHTVSIFLVLMVVCHSLLIRQSIFLIACKWPSRAPWMHDKHATNLFECLFDDFGVLVCASGTQETIWNSSKIFWADFNISESSRHQK